MLQAFVSERGVDAGATLQLWMRRYDNPRGKRYDGRCCDGFIWCFGSCDQRFRFALDKGNRYVHVYTVCPEKKRPKCFFVISSINLGWLWWNLIYSLLNKFTATRCKCFPSHLNNVLQLRCQILKHKNLSCGLQFRQIWIHLITACGSIARECVQNMHHWSGFLDELKQRLRTEWAKLDHVVIATAIRQWRHLRRNVWLYIV